MKKQFIIILALCFSFQSLRAQTFSALGNCNGIGFELFADTTDKVLYLAGAMRNINAGDTTCDAVCAWNGQIWDKKQGTIDRIEHESKGRAMARFKGDLYIAGELGNWSSMKSYGMLKWQNNTWMPIKDSSCYSTTVRGMLVTDSLLYIYGQFSSFGGITTSNIVAFDGTDYYPFPPMPNIYSSPEIAAAAFYKGKLYVGGNLNFPNGSTMQDMVAWNGTAWEAVGNGFGVSGGMAWVNDMTIFEDKLVVCGSMQLSAGNQGNGCAAWDGTNWSPMNTWNGVTGGYTMDVEIFNGELYAAGNNGTAGALMKWTGSNWQTLANPFPLGSVTKLEVWNGDLYIGGNFNYFNYQAIIKYNSATGITSPLPASSLKLYPNPAQDRLQLELNQALLSQGFALSILDSQGKTLYQGKCEQANLSLNLQGYATGTYYVVLENKEQKMSTKFVKE